jgi:hypothetical protein
MGVTVLAGMLEKQVLSAINGNVAWPLVERFSTLERVSGSPDERQAAAYICEVLDGAGVPYKLHEPVLYLSTPGPARITLDRRQIQARPPAFSASTPPQGVTGSLVYLPSGRATSTYDLFSSDLGALPALTGKIALVDGMPMPLKVSQVQAAGAVAGIFIHPGSGVHEGIATEIWGTPSLEDLPRKPRIPVVGVSADDAAALVEAASAQARVTVRTSLEEGWHTCPLVVAEIRGEVLPEQFLLLHGHLDSWYAGVGDNATGNGALLELALAFHRNRRHMSRSLRVAWWPGHSTGRYAGSTWYSDEFALDLYDNCVAQANCDSPGCRHATEYRHLPAMSEARDFVGAVIRDVAGTGAGGIETERPPRAGDYSFNNLGITGFLMLSSSMPAGKAAEEHLYAVGGCGGNIEWHTARDTMEIADRGNLMRDMRVYGASASRVISGSILPFDFRAVAAEFSSSVARYQALAGSIFDYSDCASETRLLAQALERFYRRSGGASTLSTDDAQSREYNLKILGLSRLLVPLNYARAGTFYHDPALNVPPLPGLAPAPLATGQEGFLRAGILRGANQYRHTLARARSLIEG